MAGKIGDAIADTQRLYPGLLDSDPKLLFLLKCRQFIEMVSGVDVSESNSQVLSSFTKAQAALLKLHLLQSSSPRIAQQSVIQSTKSYKKPRSNLAANFSSPAPDLNGTSPWNAHLKHILLKFLLQLVLTTTQTTPIL